MLLVSTIYFRTEQVSFPLAYYVYTTFPLQRENIELYLKGCESYGLKTTDLFQVNDLYEAKNLYIVVDNLFALGGMVSAPPPM